MSFDAFLSLARTAASADGGAPARGRLVPVWREVVVDTETPVALFARLRQGPFAFLLESAPAGSETWSRWTFMGTAPRAAWRVTDGVVEEWTPGSGWTGARRRGDPLADLERVLREYAPVDVPEIGDFWAGAVGYFSYDVVRYIEHLPRPPRRVLDVPDALFLLTGAMVVVDNLRSLARVVVGVPVADGASEAELRAAYDAAEREIEGTVARLSGPAQLAPLRLDPAAPPASGRSNYARDRFMADVRRIKDYIVAGDAFQVLLARRITVPHDFPAETLYRALRTINPSPYMYHLVLDGVEIVGSSPELLVRVRDRRVTVRPIAGTRPRGRTPAEDEEMAAELAVDEKERAEHFMLVDLGRNDVGRVARFGSVRVTELMAIERYSHVLHLVSQVEGDLHDGLSAMDALRASFPAGTMTGAPKVRAMEIIDELEPERRGPYAGAVGYIGAGAERMDLAITIRTCVMAGGIASVQAGAGIVYDSVPEREWDETENKARALLTAIGRVRAGAHAGTGLAAPGGGPGDRGPGTAGGESSVGDRGPTTAPTRAN